MMIWTILNSFLKKNKPICFSVRSGLKEIFIYPAGMNIKTPEFEGFLHEVWAKHWESKKLHKEEISSLGRNDIYFWHKILAAQQS